MTVAVDVGHAEDVAADGFAGSADATAGVAPAVALTVTVVVGAGVGHVAVALGVALVVGDFALTASAVGFPEHPARAMALSTAAISIFLILVPLRIKASIAFVATVPTRRLAAAETAARNFTRKIHIGAALHTSTSTSTDTKGETRMSQSITVTTGGPATSGGRVMEFDGGAGDYLGTQILAALVTVCTLGICYPYALVLLERWRAKHTILHGRRLHFQGTGVGLFGLWIKWFFLIVITLGIYSFWVFPRITRWKIENTVYAA